MNATGGKFDLTEAKCVIALAFPYETVELPHLGEARLADVWRAFVVYLFAVLRQDGFDLVSQGLYVLGTSSEVK